MQKIMLIGSLVVALSLAAACVGCTSPRDIDIERLDALYDAWWRDYTNKLAQASGGTVETPPQDADADGGTVETPPQDPGDAVPYGALQWRYGGFNGAGAKLDSPRLSGLKSNGRVLTYKWAVGLSGWGLPHDDAGAICAVFFERNGEWVGGKFDWVSTSRASRELKHVESYSSWPQSGITLPHSGRVAFVVVSADGKLRSNVVVAEAK